MALNQASKQILIELISECRIMLYNSSDCGEDHIRVDRDDWRDIENLLHQVDEEMIVSELEE